MSKKKAKPTNNTIAQNKRVRFDYFIVEKFEAGLVLQGWEVKSIRAGKAQLTDSYVHIRNGEAFLLNCQIQPLQTASTHFVCEPTRYRKLLLHDKEIAKLAQYSDQKGHTVVATALYWKRHLIKAEICLAKGKQQHDKRQTEKERDWNREKQRTLQSSR